MQTNNSAQNQASYHRWTWIVALILVLILLWILLTGRGPSHACCNISATTPAEVTIPTTDLSIDTPVNQNFSFTATQNEVTSTGDSSNITWLDESENLKILLKGEDLRAQGDDKKVLLSGIVNSEAIKVQKGVDAQVFFGSAVTIDNQLVIKADSPVAASEPPAAVKLYFDIGKTTLPNDASTNLAAIIEWLKAHPEAKAVLSGYHDPSGNKISNEKLAKNRAESVEDALEAAGIDDDRIDKRKPQSVDGGADLAEARRVEVSIE